MSGLGGTNEPNALAVRESQTVIASPQSGMAAGERLRIHRFALSSRWLWALSLAAILLLAAGLRLYRLDLIDFRFDQAYPLQYAMDIVRGHVWGVQPHGSVASHPAAYLYVMALPYLVTRNFMVVVAYRVLFDVLAVALCGWVGARYFNWRVGFIAALLFAVAPWAIQFARNLWPVTQPLFSAVLLIGLLEIVQRRNPWGWAISGLGIALVAGTHLGGVYVLPVALIAFLIGRKTFKIGPALIGAMPIALVVLAFVMHDASHGWENVRAYLSALGGGAQWNANVVQFGLWLSGGEHLGDLTGQSSPQWNAQMPAFLSLLDTLQMIWLVASAAWLIYRVTREAVTRRNLGCAQPPCGISRLVTSERATEPAKASTPNLHLSILIVLLWLCVPILLQLRSSRPVMMQYLPMLLPAPFLIMALGADDLFTGLKHFAQRAPGAPSLRAIASAASAIALLGIGAIVIWQVTTTLRFTAFVDQHNTQGGYTLLVRSAWAARQNAVDAWAHGEVQGDLIAVIHDFPTPWNEQAAILRAVLSDVPYRFLNSESDGLLFRPVATHYIFAPGAKKMLDALLSRAKPGSALTRSIETQPGSNVRYTYVLLKEPIDLMDFESAPKAQWESGIELLDYRIAKRARSLQVETLLRVTQRSPEGVDYHWYNHVFAGDEKIAQADGAGVHPASWRAGDLLLQSFRVELPEQIPSGTMHVRVGSYRYPEIADVMVTEVGNAPANGVDLPVLPSRFTGPDASP